MSNYDDVYSVSAAPFSIRPKITGHVSAAASTIRVGTNNSNAIQWSLNGSLKVTSVDVLYSTNGPGGPFNKTIAVATDAATGACDWNGVANDVSTNVVVRVVDAGNANVIGNSGVFAIQGHQPHRAERRQDWAVGSSHNITWTKQGLSATWIFTWIMARVIAGRRSRRWMVNRRLFMRGILFLTRYRTV